jgi:tetratricopeptide (TPR) repeat protein
MKHGSICLALVALVACTFSGQATSQPRQSEVDDANRFFAVGKFAEAGELYAQITAQDPTNYSAILQLGRIALLSNQLGDGQKWFEMALALQPDADDAKVMLSEAFYRRDDFQSAAASLRGVDVATNKLVISQYPTLNVAKLESFKGQTPYDVQGDGRSWPLADVPKTADNARGSASARKLRITHNWMVAKAPRTSWPRRADIYDSY